MPKLYPHLALGYGTRTGASSKPGLPVGPVPGTQGQSLAQSIRQSKGWGK